MSHLTIYKASAGSGKTFTLTRRYLELLFEKKDNYKHILAATFTNKATEEMKQRIISELYLLANGDESAHRSYLLERLPQLKTEENLNQIADFTLASILHDYSRFSVTTIDRFFQKIIRSFAREMNVASNYNIELDTESVLTKASEQLFFDLDKRGNEQLLKWVTHYAEEQIENGDSWNFTNSITTLSKEFLKEEYKALNNNNENQLGNFLVLNAFLEKITKHNFLLKKQWIDLAQRGVNICEKYNLETSDFKNGKRSGVNFIFKMALGEVPDKTNTYHAQMLEGIEGWTTAKSPNKITIDEAYNNGLHTIFTELIEAWEQDYPVYNSITIVRKNFYAMGILADLEQQLKKYTEENNLFLLANSNELIAKIIDQSDTPFIYEKTGNNFKHFMIDEFQDTSRLQWGNIKPLINNSLGEGHSSLLVGDVKQSIYRWRNSDWQQLDHKISDEYQSQAIQEVLPTNWRSTANIIKFNNTLFLAASKYLKQQFINDTGDDSSRSELFQSAYADIAQEIPEKATKNGFVSLQFYDKKDKDNWKEEALSQLVKNIEDLQDKGYHLNDIAILTRTGNEGAEISRHLLDYAASHSDCAYRYDIISNEALWISSSYDVKFLINILKYNTTKDNILATQINLIYYNYINKSTSNIANTTSQLTAEISDKLEHLTTLSLQETTEQLIYRFGLGQKAEQAIFIQSFIDLINQFELNQNGGIDDFLLWWDEKGYKISVSTPEGQDAINIMTIHKSKGLEYKIIIVPFLGWEIENSKGYLWTSTEQEPLNDISHFAIKINKNLINSVFKADYTHEILLQYIDNLNLLYVAFTRAKEGLYGYGYAPNTKKTDGLLANILSQESTASENSINFLEYWDTEELKFTFGSLPQVKTKSTEKDNNLWLKQYSSNKQNNNLKLRLQSHDFAIKDDELFPTASKTGKIWHQLFEQISSINELPQAITSLAQEGIVAADTAEELLKTVKKAINQPIVKSWFSGKAIVHNEAAILTPEGYNYRPDRIVEIKDEIIVIDFKFGNIIKKSYDKQVNRYVNLIQEMGHQKVKGYLWYVVLNKIVEVK